MSSPEESNGGPVIRDPRRLDPATGQVREPGQGGSAQPGTARGPGKPKPGRHAAAAAGSAPHQGQGRAGADRKDAAERTAAEQDAVEQLAERTADLQRLNAEYANYRQRVERDRGAARGQALADGLCGRVPGPD